MATHRILLVDDDEAIRFGVRDFLEAHGYEVVEAATCQAAREIYQSSKPDAAIVDYKLPDGNALDLVPELKRIDSAIPLVVLTGHGSIELAVQAIKEGADHFLTKPVELPALRIVLQRLLEDQRNRQRQLARRSSRARAAVDPFLGESLAIRRLAEQTKKVLGADSPILIQGETGTGKGVFARWLHDHSPRAEEAFVDLNCAGLAPEFLETELFGHEKGAFTGAVNSKAGLLEVAHRGTVFLDEIGDMDLQVQPKLLKVVEEKQFRRLGDVRDRRVDIRLIAATHQNLDGLVRDNKFRGDLYFRVNTITFAVPALRERKEDIVAIARVLLHKLGTDLGRGEVHLATDAERALEAYPWPGNIRELSNVLERALLFSERDVLTPGDLQFTPLGDASNSAVDGRLTLRELEHRHIEFVLRDEQGRVEAAAKRLGIPRSSLYQKIKQYHIVLPKL